jgi:hypothetical protein
MWPYIPTLNYIVHTVVLLQLLLRYLMEDKRQTLIIQACTSQCNTICLTNCDYQI